MEPNFIVGLDVEIPENNKGYFDLPGGFEVKKVFISILSIQYNIKPEGMELKIEIGYWKDINARMDEFIEPCVVETIRKHYNIEETKNGLIDTVMQSLVHTYLDKKYIVNIVRKLPPVDTLSDISSGLANFYVNNR